MERNIQRINGIKTDLGHLSDSELEAYMGYTHDRIEEGVRDLEKLGIESAHRFAAEEVAVDGLARVIPFPGQGVLFDSPPDSAA